MFGCLLASMWGVLAVLLLVDVCGIKLLLADVVAAVYC